MEAASEYLTSNQLRARYGDRSHMWIERRLKDASNPLPKPIYIGRLRFWLLADIEAWERHLAAVRVAA